MKLTNHDHKEELLPADLFHRVGDICTVVTEAMNTKELLEASLRMTMDLFTAQRGSIFLLKENGTELVLKIALGMETDDQEKMVKRLGEGIVGRVAEIKKPLIVEDIARDERFRGFKSRHSYGTPSFICTPLMIKDRLIGVINIADKKSGGCFNESELQLLDFLSSQIALNYLRIQLYQKFKNTIKESQNLKSELDKTSSQADHLKRQIILQEKLASIGKLAGGIAHEFNNPLDGVIRYTNLSLEHLKDDDVVRGYLLEVRHGLNRMANIVRNLLACTRNGCSQAQTVDVNQAADQAIQSMQSDFFHKNICLEKNLDNHIPPITDLGVERIVSNLLRNAVDAVGEGGRINIATALYDHSVSIKVSDSGCGIPEESIDKIFEPFFTTKDLDKGCGLGLTIVNEVVKSYNGKIEVQSLPRQGTIFTVTLPTVLSPN